MEDLPPDEYLCPGTRSPCLRPPAFLSFCASLRNRLAAPVRGFTLQLDMRGFAEVVVDCSPSAQISRLTPASALQGKRRETTRKRGWLEAIGYTSVGWGGGWVGNKYMLSLLSLFWACADERHHSKLQVGPGLRTIMTQGRSIIKLLMCEWQYSG